MVLFLVFGVLFVPTLFEVLSVVLFVALLLELFATLFVVLFDDTLFVPDESSLHAPIMIAKRATPKDFRILSS